MQINNILFPVDFSEESQAAKADVEWLAAKFGASVTLLHVFFIPTAYYGGVDAPYLGDSAIRDFAAMANRDLDNFQLNVPASRVKRVLREGSPAAHIAQWAKDQNPDLIVIGTRGNGIFRRMLLGSVAMKVLHDVDVPVWTCNRVAGAMEARRTSIKRVLCPVDLSEETPLLLRYAADVSESFGADVELVHSLPLTATRPSRYLDVPVHRALEEMAREDLQQMQAEAGTRFPITITGDGLISGVVDLASRAHDDLILIGRGHLQRAFGGLRSHAFDVIRAASCPVLSFCLSSVKKQQNVEELHATLAES